MNDKIDIEAALRASLAEHARGAPAAGVLAERIIAEVDLLPSPREPRRARQWRTWTLPLVAAGSVAAVAAALVGITQFGHTADRKSPAVPLTSVPTPTTQPTPTPTVTKPSPTTTRAAVNEVGLAHFQVIDLTFVGSDHGWALGTADCLDASGGPCAAMVRTTDGGVTWHSMKPPSANVPSPVCSDPCIQHIRFATDQIGYAFGPSALFMTTDGGKSWQSEPGGADALETLDGNVIRVAARNGCSPPGCSYGVQTAPIGSAVWHDVGLSATTTGSSVGVALARTGRGAIVEVFGHTSGGGQNATSALYTSADDGATWASRGEPCPQSGGEIDSTAITTAPDGSVTVLCTRRGAQGAQFTSTSTDGGASWRPGSLDSLGAAPVTALGAASASVLFASSDDTYRSGDGGQHWQRLGANGGSEPGPASWIGFESATVGRAVSNGGATIWTTRDAGLTWKPYTFH